MTKQLTRDILISLRELRRETQGILEEQSKKYNISTTQLFILDNISKDPGSSLHDLAKKVNLSPSTTSEAVEKMVQSQLVIREASPSNRRCVELSLTTKGQITLQTTFDDYVDVFTILDELGEEALLQFYETQQAIIKIIKQRSESRDEK